MSRSVALYSSAGTIFRQARTARRISFDCEHRLALRRFLAGRRPFSETAMARAADLARIYGLDLESLSSAHAEERG
jgi:hypothetical protein